MFPHERSLVKKMEGKPFALVGVNSDADRDELKKKNEAEQITWRSFSDGSGGPIAKNWRIQGWPTLYLIDHKGVMREKWVGAPEGETMDKAIEKLVAEAEKDTKPAK